MKPTATKARLRIVSGALLSAALIFIPATALAAVSITEVMYDAPGSDSGHEWIEIANTGSDTVSIAGYKLAEGGTNHGITTAQGTSTLAAGEVGILSNNPQDFLQDFPHYSGALFKSAFSLSNTGEDIALKDSSLNIVSSVTYRSTLGAGGDGNSLHASGSAWVPGAPNPGSLTATKALVKVAPAPTAKKSTASKSSSAPVFGSESGTQSAAVAQTAAPLSSPAASDTLWSAGLGLAALIVIATGAALYLRGAQPAAIAQETTPAAGEFDIE